MSTHRERGHIFPSSFEKLHAPYLEWLLLLLLVLPLPAPAPEEKADVEEEASGFNATS